MQHRKEITKIDRDKTSMMESLPELFDQPCELDLWKQVHTVGIEGLEMVSQYEWNFSNLDDAFEEGGVLHGKRVYLFSSSEPQLVFFDGQQKVTHIPTVIAIVSPSPPSDKIAVLSTISGQCEENFCEKILGMRQMNMEWVPYTPAGQRAEVEILEPQIFVLSFVQRRADIEDLIITPYLYNPLAEAEQLRTFVSIIYPSEQEPNVIDAAIAENNLSEDQREDFEEFVRNQVREGQRASLEAIQNRVIARASEVAAIFSMRFYKFYPVVTADAPNISEWKVPFMSRYYGRAHQVF